MSKFIYERRTLIQPIEFRSTGDRKITASGYAAVFGKRSQNLGGFVEVVAPTAFNKTIKESDVRALFNHDANAILGRVSAGTLRLGVDERGLHYEVDLPDTTVGRDVAVLMERGDITGSSFGFRKIEDNWDQRTEDGYPLRELRAVHLRDVSPVTYPAYTDADSALRSLAESRSLDFDEVKAAAEANELRDILTTSNGPSQEFTEPEPEAEEVKPAPKTTKAKAPEAEAESVDPDVEKEGREAPTVHLHERRYVHL